MGIICFCPHCGNKITITIERVGKVGGIISGAISGAIMGSNIGIAGGPLGAIAGTIPGLIIGAILGDNIGSKIDNPVCLKCNTSFKIPQKSIEDYKQKKIYEEKIEEDEVLNRGYYLKATRAFNYCYSFVDHDIKDLLLNHMLNEIDDNYVAETSEFSQIMNTVDKNFGKKNVTRLLEELQKLNNTLGLEKDYMVFFNATANNNDLDNVFESYYEKLIQKIENPSNQVTKAILQIYGAEITLLSTTYLITTVLYIQPFMFYLKNGNNYVTIDSKFIKQYINNIDFEDLLQQQRELKELKNMHPPNFSSLKTRYDFS